MSAQHDLHAHSTASDGSLSPAELVARAHRQGVGVLALTDHDTTAGLAEAAEAARDTGLRLVPGVEISVTWQHQTIHVVGLHVDPDDPRLQAGLARLRTFRDWRAAEIARRLERAGIPGALDGARAYAQGTIVSRTHFARFLVEQGYASELRQVFRRYLVQGKPGHVPGQWTTLEDAVQWIRGAGGQAVIAHPGRYRLTASKMGRLLDAFVECGGEGIEVVTGSHSKEDCRVAAVRAQRFSLWGSCGSDFHSPENAWIELGALPELPQGCRPIWESPRWGGAGSEPARAALQS